MTLITKPSNLKLQYFLSNFVAGKLILKFAT